MRRILGYTLTILPFAIIVGAGIYEHGVIMVVVTIIAILALAGCAVLGIILLTEE